MDNRVPFAVAAVNELARVKKQNPTKWTSGTNLERLAEKLGYKPSYGAREARRLAAKGTIERSETEEGYVQYKAR